MFGIKITITFFLCIFLGLPIHAGKSEGNNLAPADIPLELLTCKWKKRNLAYLISPDSVLRKLKEKRGLVIVDVREMDDFRRFKIPGSINIPAFALSKKPFLKSKTLVLVNEGFNYSKLEQACQRLRKSGFHNVSILIGGLSHWREKGLPIEGDVFAQKSLNKIPPREFFAERNYENLVLVDVSGIMSPEASSLMPGALSVPYRKQAKKFVHELKEVLQPHKNDPLISVLIFNQNGRYPQRMEGLIRKAGIKNVFYLKDGLEGYKTFLQKQALILRTKNTRKIVKKCVTCP
jgi:rhodanese-related sulfurtransferase